MTGPENQPIDVHAEVQASSLLNETQRLGRIEGWMIGTVDGKGKITPGILQRLEFIENKMADAAKQSARAIKTATRLGWLLLPVLLGLLAQALTGYHIGSHHP